MAQKSKKKRNKHRSVPGKFTPRIVRETPMAANGDGTPPGIPADLVWDAENPPIIYECTQDIEHAPDCDGTCEGMVVSESMVNLINEGRAYGRAQMSFLGVPQSMSMLGIPGVNVEILDLFVRVNILQDILIENFDVSKEEIDERFRVAKFNKLNEIRTAIEPTLREKRLEQQLGVAKKSILGPDGKPIG